MTSKIHLAAESPPDAALLAPTAALLGGFELPSEPAPEAASESTSLAEIQLRQGLRIGPVGLMVRYADGSELTELPAMHRLPNAPAWLLGMVNLHGLLVPVFDLARRFGFARTAPAQPMLLVLGHGADAAGVVIDGLPRRLRFDRAELVEADTVPDALRGIVVRSALIEQQLWFDLDCAALLASLEKSLRTVQ